MRVPFSCCGTLARGTKIGRCCNALPTSFCPKQLPNASMYSALSLSAVDVLPLDDSAACISSGDAHNESGLPSTIELFCKDVGVRDVVLLLFGTEVALCSLLLLSRWSKGGDVGIGGDTTVDIGSTNFPSAINFNIACGILNP